MLTPVGVLGGIRGVFFANMGGGHFEGPAVQVVHATSSEIYTPIIGYRADQLHAAGRRSTARRQIVDGLRLVDARASYGIGLETFALGFPVHFDWSWRTLFNKDWEDLLFAAYGGSSAFRKPKFSVWIGYDF